VLEYAAKGQIMHYDGAKNRYVGNMFHSPAGSGAPSPAPGSKEEQKQNAPMSEAILRKVLSDVLSGLEYRTCTMQRPRRRNDAERACEAQWFRRREKVRSKCSNSAGDLACVADSSRCAAVTLLYCDARARRYPVHSMRIVHRDVKPENLYVLHRECWCAVASERTSTHAACSAVPSLTARLSSRLCMHCFTLQQSHLARRQREARRPRCCSSLLC
jgi:serine/threonine protein kinase